MVERDSAVTDERDAFFEFSGDLLGVAGLDGFFKRLNPAWTPALGWSIAELCAVPWLDFVHPDDRPATVAATEALRGGTNVSQFTNRYRCRDGAHRWLEWHSVSALRRGLIYCVARDVTARHDAVDALAELTESLAITLDSIGDAVIATDAAGAVLRMNPVAERLTGWSLAVARGRPAGEILRLVHATTRRSVENPVARALREGAAVGLADETRLVRRDGTELPIADSCAPIRDARGAVRGAVLVFRDTTAERGAREAREKVQRQLVVAERMASVGTLAAGVAHEINNPLAYVQGNLDFVLEKLAAEKGLDPELGLALEDAREGAVRVREIVRDL
ncbi:MAG: Sensory box histidine kinase/response regulator, partial [Myxococcaceae bacterium]|nr:Sensory box histidine kinase/response regulator [Myxococcaceae bacterium]